MTTLERVALAAILVNVAGLALDARGEPSVIDFIQYAINWLLGLAVVAAPLIRRWNTRTTSTENG